MARSGSESSARTTRCRERRHALVQLRDGGSQRTDGLGQPRVRRQQTRELLAQHVGFLLKRGDFQAASEFPAARFPETPLRGQDRPRWRYGCGSGRRTHLLPLLKGAELHSLSREIGAMAATLSEWRDAYPAGAEANLNSREALLEEMCRGRDPDSLHELLRGHSHACRNAACQRARRGRGNAGEFSESDLSLDVGGDEVFERLQERIERLEVFHHHVPTLCPARVEEQITCHQVGGWRARNSGDDRQHQVGVRERGSSRHDDACVDHHVLGAEVDRWVPALKERHQPPGRRGSLAVEHPERARQERR